jgi:hypothetical protein
MKSLTEQQLLSALEKAKQKYDTLPLLIKTVQDERKKAQATTRSLLADYAKLEASVRRVFIEMKGNLEEAFDATSSQLVDLAPRTQTPPTKKATHARKAGRAS